MASPLGRAVSRLPWPVQKHLRNLVELVTNRHGNRRILARAYIYEAVSPLVPSFEIQSGDARFVLNTSDREVSRILFVRGEYDRPLLSAVHELLSRVDGRQFSLEERLFLDIGANLGSATVEAMVHFGAAGGIAFEPDPVNFSFLQRNLAANGLIGHVDAHQLALSDRTGSVAFELSPDNAGDHRVRLDGEPLATALGEAEREVVEVEATTLDQLCDDGTVDLGRVGLAWIDVQGHEPNMLAGAEQLTGAEIPLVVEYSPYHLGTSGGLDRFDEIVTTHYTHLIDTDHGRDGVGSALKPISELASIRSRLVAPDQHTDLILLSR